MWVESVRGLIAVESEGELSEVGELGGLNGM